MTRGRIDTVLGPDPVRGPLVEYGSCTVCRPMDSETEKNKQTDSLIDSKPLVNVNSECIHLK